MPSHPGEDIPGCQPLPPPSRDEKIWCNTMQPCCAAHNVCASAIADLPPPANFSTPSTSTRNGSPRLHRHPFCLTRPHSFSMPFLSRGYVQNRVPRASTQGVRTSFLSLSVCNDAEARPAPWKGLEFRDDWTTCSVCMTTCGADRYLTISASARSSDPFLNPEEANNPIQHLQALGCLALAALCGCVASLCPWTYRCSWWRASPF